MSAVCYILRLEVSESAPCNGWLLKIDVQPVGRQSLKAKWYVAVRNALDSPLCCGGLKRPLRAEPHSLADVALHDPSDASTPCCALEGDRAEIEGAFVRKEFR